MNGRAITGAFIVVIMLLTASLGEAAVGYVNCDKATNGGGASWGDAFNTIQAGVAAASFSELWVKGTCNLSSTITVNRSVGIYGGFAGTEAARTDRNWRTNVTTINAGGVAGRQCIVITADYTTIDGFSITGGRHATDAGGIHINLPTSLTNSWVYIQNCRIYSNTGGEGGGISTRDPVTISNCLIYRNTALADGGGVYANIYPVTIINSTIAYNTATYDGGGYYSWNITNPKSTITNTIFWGNTAQTGSQIYYSPTSGGNPTVTYSDISGGFSGTGNINSDPKFVNGAGNDYHLQKTPVISPCIDKGNNSAYPLPTTDMDGNPRIADGDDIGSAIVDMGAYEYPAPDIAPPSGTILINSGAASVNTTTVTVTNSVTDPSGVSDMCLAESPATCPDYPTSPWEAFAATKVMTLSSGEGTKTVNAWFRDTIGNLTPSGLPSPFVDTIILDTTKPVDGTLVTTDGNGVVLLNWFGFSDALSGIASYKLVSTVGFTPPADCSGSGIPGCSGTSCTHTTPAGTTNSYRLCAIDNATNMSNGATASGTAWNSSPVRLASVPATPYTSIQTAYAAAAVTDVIMLRETGFRETLDFNLPVSVTLQGAYDPDFMAVQPDAASDVYGSLTISSGTVTIGEVFIF